MIYSDRLLTSLHFLLLPQLTSFFSESPSSKPVLFLSIDYFYFPTAVNILEEKLISSVVFYLGKDLEVMKTEVVNSFKNLNGYILHKNCSNTNHPCAFYFPYMSLFPSGCYKLNHYFCHPVMILFYLHGYISCVRCQWNFLT